MKLSMQLFLAMSALLHQASGQGFTPLPTPAPVTPAPTIESFNSYFNNPEQKWSIQLPDTGAASGSKVARGNTVQVSPDGSTVYVTLDDARIDVLSAFDGAHRKTFRVTPLISGARPTCRSGVFFGESEANGSFLVYAIIDPPPAFDGQPTRYVQKHKLSTTFCQSTLTLFVSAICSRVIAMAHPSNDILWVSDPIEGEVQGTPIINSGLDRKGEFIYFTHNSVTPDGAAVGIFSAMDSSSGSLLFSEVAGSSPNDPQDLEGFRIETLQFTYGPLGVSHIPIDGRYPGGARNSNDIFVWSTSDADGRGPNGYTRAFQVPSNWDGTFGK